MIRSVGGKTKYWEAEVVIPKSLLALSITMETNENEGKKELVIQNEESIQFIAKRMHFYKEKMIRIINSEGIDTLYDLETQTIVAFSKRDNLDA